MRISDWSSDVCSSDLETAQRLKNCVRSSDTVARLGGDEFTIILSNLNDSATLEYVAQNILDRLTEPFRLGDEMVYLSTSIGITIYPDDATDVEIGSASCRERVWQYV